MQILDLDLDAFVKPIAHWPNGERLDSNQYKPWKKSALRKFLEGQCGLSTSAPAPGKFMEHHDAAYDYTQRLNKEIGSEINIVHVDAHADLGLGDGSWLYMHAEHLQKPIPQRASPKRGSKGLNSGSWLAFAVAAGWISSITYVHPDGGCQDLHGIYFKNCDTSSGSLALKTYSRKLFISETPAVINLTKHFGLGMIGPSDRDGDHGFRHASEPHLHGRRQGPRMA